MPAVAIPAAAVIAPVVEFTSKSLPVKPLAEYIKLPPPVIEAVWFNILIAFDAVTVSFEVDVPNATVP